MKNIIIVGCGRVGSQLANLLSDNGDNVCCIDLSPQAFQNLGATFNGTTVLGMGFDEDVLENAGISDCDALCAVTQSDKTNIMCAEVASRLYDVPLVIARLYNPGHENAYSQIGVDYVCGTQLVATEIFSKVISEHGTHVMSFGDCEVVKYTLSLANSSDSVVSMPLSDFERDHEIRVAAIERADGSGTTLPDVDSVLYDGDILLVCAKLDALEYLQ